MEARCASVVFVVCGGGPGRAFHSMGGEYPAIDRRAGTGIRAHIGAAYLAGRPGAVVLWLEGSLAVESDVCLSSLEDRFRRVVAISLPTGIGGAGGWAWLAGAHEPRTSRGLSDFHRHSFSGARILQRLSFPLLLCCRPLSIPGHS